MPPSKLNVKRLKNGSGKELPFQVSDNISNQECILRYLCMYHVKFLFFFLAFFSLNNPHWYAVIESAWQRVHSTVLQLYTSQVQCKCVCVREGIHVSNNEKDSKWNTEKLNNTDPDPERQEARKEKKTMKKNHCRTFKIQHKDSWYFIVY